MGAVVLVVVVVSSTGARRDLVAAKRTRSSSADTGAVPLTVLLLGADTYLKQVY